MAKPLGNAFFSDIQTFPGPSKAVNIDRRLQHHTSQLAEICDAGEGNSDSSSITLRDQGSGHQMRIQTRASRSETDVSQAVHSGKEPVPCRRSLSKSRPPLIPALSTKAEPKHTKEWTRVSPYSGLASRLQESRSSFDAMPLPRDREASAATVWPTRSPIPPRETREGPSKAKHNWFVAVKETIREAHETGPRGDGEHAMDLIRALQGKPRKTKKTKDRSDKKNTTAQYPQEVKSASSLLLSQTGKAAPDAIYRQQSNTRSRVSFEKRPQRHHYFPITDSDLRNPAPAGSQTTPTQRDTQSKPLSSPLCLATSFDSFKGFGSPSGPADNSLSRINAYAEAVSPLTSVSSLQDGNPYLPSPRRSSSIYSVSPLTDPDTIPQRPRQQGSIPVSLTSREVDFGASASVVDDARETIVDLDKPLPQIPIDQAPDAKARKQQRHRRPAPKPLVAKPASADSPSRGRQATRELRNEVGHMPPLPLMSTASSKTPKAVAFELGAQNNEPSIREFFWDSFKLPHRNHTCTAKTNKSILKSQISAPRRIRADDERNFNIAPTPAAPPPRPLEQRINRKPLPQTPDATPIWRPSREDPREGSTSPRHSKRTEHTFGSDSHYWRSSASKLLSRFSRNTESTEQEEEDARIRHRSSSDASFACQGIVHIGYVGSRKGSADSRRDGCYLGEPDADVYAETTSLETEQQDWDHAYSEPALSPPPLRVSKQSKQYEGPMGHEVQRHPVSRQTVVRDTHFYELYDDVLQEYSYHG
jgi:hypothetical protein